MIKIENIKHKGVWNEPTDDFSAEAEQFSCMLQIYVNDKMQNQYSRKKEFPRFEV